MSKKKNVHAVALGRKGGRIGGKVRSEAKAAVARANGAKGGRPPHGVHGRRKDSYD